MISNIGVVLVEAIGASCGQGGDIVCVGLRALHVAPLPSLDFKCYPSSVLDCGLCVSVESSGPWAEGSVKDLARGLDRAGRDEGSDNSGPEGGQTEHRDPGSLPLMITEGFEDVGDHHRERIDDIRLEPIANRMASSDCTGTRSSKWLAQGDKTLILTRAMARKATQREGENGSGITHQVKRVIRRTSLCGVTLGEAEAKAFGEFVSKCA